MTARLLLHLLALDAATQAGFCWIDEPLEHRDPIRGARSRRWR
jgi:hypothetical protein